MKRILTLSLALLCQACVNQTDLAKQAVESSVLHYSKISYRQLESFPGKVASN